MRNVKASFRLQKRSLFLVAYLIFAILPIYWMVNMSFKSNEEILSSFSFCFFILVSYLNSWTSLPFILTNIPSCASIISGMVGVADSIVSPLLLKCSTRSEMVRLLLSFLKQPDIRIKAANVNNTGHTVFINNFFIVRFPWLGAFYFLHHQ